MLKPIEARMLVQEQCQGHQRIQGSQAMAGLALIQCKKQHQQLQQRREFQRTILTVELDGARRDNKTIVSHSNSHGQTSTVHQNSALVDP